MTHCLLRNASLGNEKSIIPSAPERLLQSTSLQEGILGVF
uniref:Uncharacterized protein n=1 Tax=Lepeophtheirus salmonis TaxID=72036 RepID=A0A0K2UK75_LEPSM